MSSWATQLTAPTRRCKGCALVLVVWQVAPCVCNANSSQMCTNCWQCPHQGAYRTMTQAGLVGTLQFQAAGSTESSSTTNWFDFDVYRLEEWVEWGGELALGLEWSVVASWGEAQVNSSNRRRRRKRAVVVRWMLKMVMFGTFWQRERGRTKGLHSPETTDCAHFPIICS